jgi:hypothetical protein
VKRACVVLTSRQNSRLRTSRWLKCVGHALQPIRLAENGKAAHIIDRIRPWSGGCRFSSTT